MSCAILRGQTQRSMPRYALICALAHQRRAAKYTLYDRAPGLSDILGGPPSSYEGYYATFREKYAAL